MRGGKFYEMMPAKQVKFIERVDKTLLGLEGLQQVVYADKCRERKRENIINIQYNFLDISKKLLKTIDGRYIKQKYKIEKGVAFGEKLHKERIKWIQENI